MIIDFSKLNLSPAQPKPIVQTVNVTSICECGHDAVDHENGADCTILECICINYYPKSESYDLNGKELKIGPTVLAYISESTSEETKILNQVITEEQAKLDEVPHPSNDITAASTDDGCAHLCKCGKWWSHGARLKCRHPDVLDMGLCSDCLNGKPQEDVTEEFIDNKLTPKGIQRCYNKSRQDCANMTQEQVGYHIDYLEQKIAELRAESISARKQRAEMIEEECQKVPPAEREAFRQALLISTKESKSRKPAVKKESPKLASFSEISAAYKKLNMAQPDDKTMKLVQGLMDKMKKSAEYIVGFLND